MPIAELLKLIQIGAGLAETLAPLIQQAMATASSQDQDKIRQAAEEMHSRNVALHKTVTEKLRG